MGRRLTALLAVLVMLLLAACQGKPLPGGMEETALLDAGQEALLLLAGGDYEGVFGLLREDVAEALTAEDIRGLAAYIRAFMEDDFLCVVGSEQKIKAEADKFMNIENLS